MIKVVETCTRIEGHGNVKIYLKDDEVNRVIFDLPIYRGFESFLVGKPLLEIPKIVSRICGLCHASQSIASCKAIEDMFGTELHERHVVLRKLLLTGELLKSHGMHYIFQAFPDLLLILGIKNRILNPFEILKEFPDYTNKFLEAVNIGNQLDKIFGGRSIHLITPIPGGVLYKASSKKIKLAQKYMDIASNNLEWILDKTVELFSSKHPPEAYKLPPTSMISLHDYGSYNRYNGILRIKKFNNDPIDFHPQNYFTYFTKTPYTRGFDILFDKENPVLVGPMARNNLIENSVVIGIPDYLSFFNDTWKNNILFANIIRLMEMLKEVKFSQLYLQNPVLNENIPLESCKKLKKNEGIGVLEAPRGLLIHHYKVDEHKIIKEVKLFIATEFNLPLIDTMITNVSKELYEKTGDLNMIKEESQKIIRCFDPCVSCATH